MKFSWFITGKNSSSKDEQMIFPDDRNIVLDKMKHLAVKAKSQGMTREEIVVGALHEKERLEAKGEIGKCSNGQMDLRRMDFEQISIGPNNSFTVTVTDLPLNNDLETGLAITAIFLFCPSESIKMGRFLNSLASDASPRKLLAALVNTFETSTMTKLEKTMATKFFTTLDEIMKLSFGKVLLAVSPPSKLQTMLVEELPYIASFSTKLNECFSSSSCDGIQDVINTIGMYRYVARLG